MREFFGARYKSIIVYSLIVLAIWTIVDVIWSQVFSMEFNVLNSLKENVILSILMGVIIALFSNRFDRK